MSQVRTVSSLALLYVFRMLGLFMVLPVMMLYGSDYKGATPMLLGLAIGIYGLTQAIFQIPLGLYSDIVGRKPIIIGGFIVFAIGSVVAAKANSVEMLILGRALQGSGAIAGAVMAMVADLTSEENRTKAMAVIGASIGLSFSLAMVLGPLLASVSGLQGVFMCSALLAISGIFIVIFIVPNPAVLQSHRDVITTPQLVRRTLKDTQLLRLNWGIFSLHCVLMTAFIAVPNLLEVSLGLDRQAHWKFYLPLLLLAFVGMLPLMVYAERKRKIKPVFIFAIVVLVGSLCALMYDASSAWILVGAIFAFFVAFNLLESMLPSLVSKIAPAGAKGTAMGIYSTSQFLGAFFGGLIGGWLLQQYHVGYLFGFSALLCAVWCVFAVSMQPPRHLRSVCVSVADTEQAKHLASLRGVVEAFHAVEESLLYLKVDSAQFDEAALRELVSSH